MCKEGKANKNFLAKGNLKCRETTELSLGLYSECPDEKKQLEEDMLNEAIISRGIIEAYFDKITQALELDVAIVGGGPSGLVAGYYLAKAGKKTALFEKNLSVGGGVWGGGMMFNEIVVQEDGKAVLDEFEMETKPHEPGYYTLDSVYVTATLIHRAMKEGLRIFNLIAVEDVVIKKERVVGLVINWGALKVLEWHVDPLTILSKFVLDATGHPANVTEVLVRKMGVTLNTDTGGIVGEKSLEAEIGELNAVENTGEVYPGLYVSGMAGNAVRGGYRMGPIFGGMLLSGKKAAEEMIARL
jgi:thiamine thiazole synthase